MLHRNQPAFIASFSLPTITTKLSSQREHDSPRPSPLPSDQSNTGQHPQRMGGRGQRQGCRNRTQRTRFQGRIEALQQHVYDLHPIRTGTDTFANTTREIAEYIAPTYKGGGEFIQAMDPETLAFEELDDPRNNIPEEGQRALMEIWKGDLRLYNDRIKDQMEAAKQEYMLWCWGNAHSLSEIDSPHQRHGKESRSTPT